MRIQIDERTPFQLTDKGSTLASIKLSNSIQLEEGSNIGRGYRVLYFQGEETTYFHGFYGEFTFNKPIFEDFIRNFESGAYGQELAINFSHDDMGKAAGWIKRLYLSEDQKELLADIEWTPAGAEAIRNKEFQYFSSEFYTKKPKYRNAFGQEIENVFVGGALTNNPFLKNTQISLSETGGQNSMTKEEMITKLSESHGLDVTALQESARTLQTSLSETQTKLAEAQTKLSDAEKKVEKMEKETKEKKIEDLYNKALSEGKVVPAYKSMFTGHMSSIEFSQAEAEIAKMPKVVEFTQETQEGGTTEFSTDLSDRELLDKKVKAYSSENKISYEQALNHIRAESKKEGK